MKVIKKKKKHGKRKSSILPKFNVETYLKDGDAVIDKLKDVEECRK